MSFDLLLILFYKLTFVVVFALLLVLSLRHRPAGDRVLVLRTGIALVMLLPIAGLVLPSVNFDAPACFAFFIPPGQGPGLFASCPRIGKILLASVYAVGATMLLARLALGWLTLAKWTRKAHPIICPQWRKVIDANAAPNIRVLVSDRISAPLSWGVIRPAILIDRASLAQPEDAPAIIAHEVAHIRRWDWPALMLSRVVVALFWPHALVWLLDRGLTRHSEEAADAEAIGAVEPLLYAAALIACLGRARPVSIPANGIATGSGLARRLHQIVSYDPREMRRSSRLASMLIAAYLVVTAMIAVAAVCTEAATRTSVDTNVVHPAYSQLHRS